jgi:hypothetical protein
MSMAVFQSSPPSKATFHCVSVHFGGIFIFCLLESGFREGLVDARATPSHATARLAKHPSLWRPLFGWVSHRTKRSCFASRPKSPFRGLPAETSDTASWRPSSPVRAARLNVVVLAAIPIRNAVPILVGRYDMTIRSADRSEDFRAPPLLKGNSRTSPWLPTKTGARRGSMST